MSLLGPGTDSQVGARSCCFLLFCQKKGAVGQALRKKNWREKRERTLRCCPQTTAFQAPSVHGPLVQARVKEVLTRCLDAVTRKKKFVVHKKQTTVSFLVQREKMVKKNNFFLIRNIIHGGWKAWKLMEVLISFQVPKHRISSQEHFDRSVYP